MDDFEQSMAQQFPDDESDSEADERKQAFMVEIVNLGDRHRLPGPALAAILGELMEVYRTAIKVDTFAKQCEAEGLNLVTTLWLFVVFGDVVDPVARRPQRATSRLHR